MYKCNKIIFIIHTVYYVLGTNPYTLYIVFIKTSKDLCYDYTYLTDGETELQKDMFFCSRL